MTSPERLDRVDVGVGGHRASELGLRPGQGLDVVGAEVAPDHRAERAQVVRGARGEHGREVHQQREVVERVRGRELDRRGRSDCSSSARGVVGRGGARGIDGREPGRRRRRRARRSGARPGSAPTSSRKGRAGGAAAYGSPGTAPAMASSAAALSRTERRHHVARDEPGPRLAVVGAERHATPRRLEPEQPARAGGDADGAAAVARVRERHHARRHRGRAAAARAAGRAGDVPRVVRGAVRVRFGGREEPELRRVGLARRSRSPRRAAWRTGTSRGRRCARRRGGAGCRGGAARRPGIRRGPSPGSARRGTDRRAPSSASARGAFVAPVDHRVELRVHRVDARRARRRPARVAKRCRRGRAQPGRWRRAPRGRRSCAGR